MTDHDDRLMVLGRMAAVLVHELRQPVTVIGLLTDALRRTPDKASLIDRLDHEVSRMIQVMQTVTSFARNSNPSVEDLSEVVRAALSSHMAADVHVGFVPGVHANGSVVRSQIEQVILNLVRNAVESTANQPIRDICVSVCRTGDWIEIRVRDNGPGIDPKLPLFKPFATTKQSGLGVGLAFCKAIIEAHDGTIELEPMSNRGACFLIRLPADRATDAIEYNGPCEPISDCLMMVEGR